MTERNREREREREADERNARKLNKESEKERQHGDITQSDKQCVYTCMYNGKTKQEGMNR